MKILLVDSIHLYKNENGQYFTPSIYNSVFLNRYYNVFGKFSIIAKTKKSDLNSLNINDLILIDSNLVNVIELPFYKGIFGLFSNWISISTLLLKYMNQFDGFIFRIAQIESYMVYLILSNLRIPHLAEVVNDPKTIIKMPILKQINLFLFKTIIKSALAVSYVTHTYLQNIYSPNNSRDVNSRIYETNYSSVELNPDDIKFPRNYSKVLTHISIIHISNTMHKDLKGHITLIKTLKLLIKNSYSVQCTIIGDGDYKRYYEKLVKKLKIFNSVVFVGNIKDRKIINEYIDKADFFIYPTKMEGLPRVLIEAMARGIPILSSPIAGIPELINENYLFKNDPKLYFNKIKYLVENYHILNEMSKENITKSQSFLSSLLNEKRSYFYSILKKEIEQQQK